MSKRELSFRYLWPKEDRILGILSNNIHVSCCSLVPSFRSEVATTTCWQRRLLVIHYPNKMPPLPHDEACMKAAIDQSQKAVEAGCMPFGAVLADANGKILVEAHNESKVAKKRGGSGDVTRHAELELVRKLSVTIDSDTRSTCTIYTSTEPCVMCSGAIYWSGVGRVVYGCSSAELEKLSGPGGFDIPIEQLYGMGRKGMRAIEIVGPLLSDQCLKVHKNSGVWTHGTSSDNIDIDTERSLFTSGLGAAAATRDVSVPVVDMNGGTPEEVANQLWEAAHNCGFFTVVGHGISQDLVDRAFQASSEFFSQSLQEKEAQSPFAKDLNAGYEYFSQLRPSTGTKDQKESLQITAREGVMEGRWPTTPSNFQETANQLMEAAHGLACRILGMLEKAACPLNEPGTLAKSHTLWAPDGQCTLRMLHYPPMDATTAKELTTPDAEGRIHWRAGPHTDW
jgi:tRNA(Arg) A34 adenosine deaminase TadA